MRPCRRRPSPRRERRAPRRGGGSSRPRRWCSSRRRDARDLVGAARARRARRPTACSATWRASGWTSATPTWRSTAARPRSRCAASTASRSARPSDERALDRGRHADDRLALPGAGARRPAAPSYRLTVPDNVPIEIETSSGTVRPRRRARVGRRSAPAPGAIAASGFCGFSLRASSDSGDVSAVARVLGRPARAALAQRRRARRRPGRPLPDRRAERLRARPASAGSTHADDAPFQIQALSTSGDVTVEAAS